MLYKRYVRMLRNLLKSAVNSAGALFITVRQLPISYDEIENILIVRMDGIGDMVLTTPLITTLKINFPSAKLSVLMSSYTRDILRGNKYIDQLIFQNNFSFLGLAKELKKNKYDLVIVLHQTIMGVLLSYLSRATYRIGYNSNYLSFLFTHTLNDDRQTNIRHLVVTNNDFAKYLNCKTISDEIQIPISQDGESKAEKLFNSFAIKRDDTVVCIHPGSSQSYIRWNKKGFAEVADILIKERKAKVIIIGSNNEQKMNNEVLAMMKEKAFQIHGMTITEVISVLKRCSLFIGNSTGTMHIAAGLKIPVVAIFGSQHPLDSYIKWGPWETNSMVVRNDTNCPNCHPGDCIDFKCMSTITPDDVIKAAYKIMKWNNLP